LFSMDGLSRVGSQRRGAQRASGPGSLRCRAHRRPRTYSCAFAPELHSLQESPDSLLGASVEVVQRRHLRAPHRRRVCAAQTRPTLSVRQRGPRVLAIRAAWCPPTPAAPMTTFSQKLSSGCRFEEQLPIHCSLHAGRQKGGVPLCTACGTALVRPIALARHQNRVGAAVRHLLTSAAALSCGMAHAAAARRTRCKAAMLFPALVALPVPVRLADQRTWSPPRSCAMALRHQTRGTSGMGGSISQGHRTPTRTPLGSAVSKHSANRTRPKDD
jgi:hypothetical protein